MTKETLKARLATLRAQHTQLVANANAVSGAIQVCEELLAQWDAPAPLPDQVISPNGSGRTLHIVEEAEDGESAS